jgi:hypothetical protein
LALQLAWLARYLVAPKPLAAMEEIPDCDFGFDVQMHSFFHQMLHLNLARAALDLDLEV